MIREAITDYLKQYKLILDTEHGFVEGLSCLTNLLIFLHLMTKYVDLWYPDDVINLDLQRTFDKVPHKNPLVMCHL